jgi:polyribonucleotide nucleotidyltransferase
LGAVSDARMVRTLEEEDYTRFTHHYNFPPFCVGEVKPLRGASRREIGHGMLAQKSVERMLPAEDDFGYTIRAVSEVLESNGSSSMASVCATTLALMDAGVQIKAPVAGIAMGLIHQDDDHYAILTDIQGLEDHAGAMDFKVSGTRSGVNALQLDMKVPGLNPRILSEGLEQAKQARLQILDRMAQVLPSPREQLSQYAPRMLTLTINTDKIGMVIGPGGKNIRRIQEEYEVKVDIDDEGLVFIFGEDGAKAQEAYDEIHNMTRDVEVGEVFTGKVVSTPTFGAFVEIMPGRDGLVHISHLAPHRVEKVEDVAKIGNMLKVRVIEVDDEGKVRLTHKEFYEGDGPSGGGSRDSGGRDRDSGSRDRDSGSRNSRGGRGGRGGGRSRREDRSPRSEDSSSSKSEDGSSSKTEESKPNGETSREPRVDRGGDDDRGKSYFREKR